MNLNANPTPEQLRELIARCDDLAGPHVLWVKAGGEVDITRLPGDAPDAFDRAHPDAPVRTEAFLAGNAYVGPEAADDEEWIAELFNGLLTEWGRTNGRSGAARVLRF